MGVMTSTGVKFYTAATLPATFDKAGYEALTWIEVKEVTTIPAYGPERQEVTHEPLATGVTETYGGFLKYGAVDISGAFVADDPGQIAMRANVMSASAQIPFRIEYPESQDDYTVGKVFTGTKEAGSANSMVATSMRAVFNKPIIEVPYVAGP